MATLTMNARNGGYIIDEEIYRSRDEVTVDNSANTVALQAGTVLGKITATGVFKELDPTASDGTEVAAGVLMYEIDKAATEPRAVHVRECTVSNTDLKFNSAVSAAQITTAKEQLVSAGIIVR